MSAAVRVSLTAAVEQRHSTSASTTNRELRSRQRHHNGRRQ
jgi:hypothetical protein